MSKQSEILEGLHYEILQKWVANGKVDKLPEGLEEYLNQLTVVLGFHNRSLNKTQIIKYLRATFGFNYSQAQSRYIDALNFFYLDKDITFEAYANITADKFEKMGDAIIQSANSPEEMALAQKPYKEAYLIRKENKPRDIIPDELFQRPNKLYTLKMSDLGVHEDVDRNETAKLVDSWDIEESEKERVKQEAGASPRKLFEDEQEAEN